jgi:hypothetical protein
VAIVPWDGTVAGLVILEESVRQAEQLVNRCRTRFIAPIPRTAAGQQPASEAQVRAAMTSGGIIEERQTQYIVAWNRLKLQGVGGVAPLPPASTRRPTYAAMRASLQEAGMPVPRTNAEVLRAYQQLTGQSQLPALPEIPPAPAPAPAPALPVPQDSIFGELQTVATDDTEYPPFGGGRQ